MRKLGGDYSGEFLHLELLKDLIWTFQVNSDLFLQRNPVPDFFSHVIYSMGFYLSQNNVLLFSRIRHNFVKMNSKGDKAQKYARFRIFVITKKKNMLFVLRSVYTCRIEQCITERHQTSASCFQFERQS